MVTQSEPKIIFGKKARKGSFVLKGDWCGGEHPCGAARSRGLVAVG